MSTAPISSLLDVVQPNDEQMCNGVLVVLTNSLASVESSLDPVGLVFLVKLPVDLLLMTALDTPALSLLCREPLFQSNAGCNPPTNFSKG